MGILGLFERKGIASAGSIRVGGGYWFPLLEMNWTRSAISGSTGGGSGFVLLRKNKKTRKAMITTAAPPPTAAPMMALEDVCFDAAADVGVVLVVTGEGVKEPEMNDDVALCIVVLVVVVPVAIELGLGLAVANAPIPDKTTVGVAYRIHFHTKYSKSVFQNLLQAYL